MLTSKFNVRRLGGEMQQPTDVGNVCCHVRRLQRVILAMNWDEILLKREDEAFRNYISVGQNCTFPIVITLHTHLS